MGGQIYVFGRRTMLEESIYGGFSAPDRPKYRKLWNGDCVTLRSKMCHSWAKMGGHPGVGWPVSQQAVGGIALPGVPSVDALGRLEATPGT